MRPGSVCLLPPATICSKADCRRSVRPMVDSTAKGCSSIWARARRTPRTRTGWPVQAPDLERDGLWPAFSEAAAGSGLRAVFAFPLRSGSVGLGALTLYQHVAGELTSEQYADALVVARFALNLLSSLQAGRPPDELDQVFTDTLASSVEVHQASGVVSVQLGISVGAALAVLRAHAFAQSVRLTDRGRDPGRRASPPAQPATGLATARTAPTLGSRAWKLHGRPCSDRRSHECNHRHCPQP
jgi:hypothetical protein